MNNYVTLIKTIHVCIQMSLVENTINTGGGEGVTSTKKVIIKEKNCTLTMLCSPISIGICMIVLMRQQLHVEHKTISHIKFYRY